MSKSAEHQKEVEYEDIHVHQVYDEIASHFSSTRFKPWPVVDRFLKDLPKGSIGLDVGCGNGKYLTVRNDVFIVASDRSPNLLKFATQHQPHSAIVADTLHLPHPSNKFDFAVCIAVIHHLSTPQRRQEGIKAILSTLRFDDDDNENISNRTSKTKNKSRSKGQALIFVWALEQKSSRRGWDKGMNQDVLVPWVLKSDHDKSKHEHQHERQDQDQDQNQDQNSTEPSTSTSTKNKNSNPKPESKQNESQAQDQHQNPNKTQDSNQNETTNRTFQRYYHLYREGELEDDIVGAGGKVVESGYDRDNWWAVCERTNG